jgi:hypothetical protein
MTVKCPFCQTVAWRGFKSARFWALIGIGAACLVAMLALLAFVVVMFGWAAGPLVGPDVIAIVGLGSGSLAMFILAFHGSCRATHRLRVTPFDDIDPNACFADYDNRQQQHRQLSPLELKDMCDESLLT